ncbi:sensor histidine kinase [Chitinophaga nivalis]|uniref:Signal transduction histidine kinase dimerisation/phosphoacceptor domain-containing protein n=1 Tax=Chitinophaga nivalis TaxID=2991709 RepID=A0ABT3ITH4_9BACT|nr:hypothetical protein [Chitinophaga nivalis]MCW3463311.1 hypothetical protein [Chitinophaga nivalis]MCW3486999.1 hypothetical protein [Chitinophaga nivalis]
MWQKINAYSCLRYIHIVAWCCVLCLAIPARAQRTQLAVLQAELVQPRDSIAYCNTLGKLAALYQMINLDTSFMYAIQEKELAGRLRYRRGVADAYDVICFNYAVKTDFDIAILYAHQALQLHLAQGDSARVCKSLSNIYLCYKNTGRQAEADNYFFEALHMASRLPPDRDSTYSILLTNYVWRYYQDDSRRDSVQWAIREGLRISRKYPRSRIPFYLHAFDAENLVRQGHGRAAEERIYRLADQALAVGLPYVAKDMYNRLDDYPRLGYYPDSARYRERSYELARATGCIELNLPALAAIYDFYDQRKDAAKLDYYSSEIMRLAAQQRYHQQAGNVNYIDYFLKERARHTLSMQNRLQQQELMEKMATQRRNKLMVAGLFTITLLLIALLFSRYWHYRLSRQQELALSRRYADISLQNTALRANDEFKNKLLSIIANDFKAPLLYIIEVAARLNKKGVDRATMAGLLREIADASGRTLVVFDNILKWIRLQLAGFVYTPVPCKLRRLVDTALTTVQNTVTEKELVVLNHLGMATKVMADEEMLKLVNIQLLQIATHYAVRGSLLLIVPWEQEDAHSSVGIIVDTGKQLKVILKELSDWQQNTYALGYAISRDFMDKMEGAISTGESEERYLTLRYVLKQ